MQYLNPHDRFLQFVTPDPATGCWNWTGSKMRNGYGQFRYETRNWAAHRVAWVLFVGPLEEGLDLDHLCRNRACVCPNHLEPVTRAENLRRGAALITRCPHGHPYDEENTYWHRGHRLCRACKKTPKWKEYIRNYYQQRHPDRATDNKDKTHCPQGHPFDEENTYRYRDARRCRTCLRAQSLASYYRLKDPNYQKRPPGRPRKTA